MMKAVKVIVVKKSKKIISQNNSSKIIILCNKIKSSIIRCKINR